MTYLESLVLSLYIMLKTCVQEDAHANATKYGNASAVTFTYLQNVLVWVHPIDQEPA
jgi:hypothetical protein